MPRHNDRPSQNLMKQVNLRFTEDDYQRLQEIAAGEGMFITDVIRHYVVSALHPRLP